MTYQGFCANPFGEPGGRALSSASLRGIQRSDFYEIRPRRNKRGVDLISDAVPFGRLWYGEPEHNHKRNRLRKVLESVT
jgi:hypothetical protein